jgi:mRNA guanylyltransferase
MHSNMLIFSSYYLCEKTDGMRYLLYLTQGDQREEVQYLIDRKNDYWYIPPQTLHFPTNRSIESFHTYTLLDGELVLDKEPDGSMQPRFMVFDCMVLDKKPLMSRTLDKRLAYCKENIVKPYKALLTEYPDEIPHLHFLLEMKAFEMSYGVEMMFRDRLPNLPHGNDGLVFTCRETPYQHGTDHNILKWKPEDENSIDFRMSFEWQLIPPDDQDIAEGFKEPYPDYDQMPAVNLFVFNGNGKPDTWFAPLYLEPNEWESLKSLNEPLDDRIVECFMDEQKRWRYMRFRDDKTTGNHASTVESVIESIRDRVTKEDLIEAAKGIKVAWKQREADQKAMASRTANAPNGGTKRKAEEQGNGRPSPAPPGSVKSEESFKKED